MTSPTNMDRATLIHCEHSSRRRQSARSRVIGADTRDDMIEVARRGVGRDDTANRDRDLVITDDILREAGERIIQSRATHSDHLTDKLQEERARGITVWGA